MMTQRVRNDNICAPSTETFAGLLKATLPRRSGSVFQPYLSLSAGGLIRHASKVIAPNACGPKGRDPCVDTVAGGRAVRTRFGFRYDVADAVGIVAQIGGLDRRAEFTANGDVNIGLAFRL